MSAAAAAGTSWWMNLGAGLVCWERWIKRRAGKKLGREEGKRQTCSSRSARAVYRNLVSTFRICRPLPIGPLHHHSVPSNAVYNSRHQHQQRLMRLSSHFTVRHCLAIESVIVGVPWKIKRSIVPLPSFPSLSSSTGKAVLWLGGKREEKRGQASPLQWPASSQAWALLTDKRDTLSTWQQNLHGTNKYCSSPHYTLPTRLRRRQLPRPWTCTSGFWLWSGHCF